MKLEYPDFSVIMPADQENVFPTTHWSLLAKASLAGEAETHSALDDLCQRYWLPVRQFIEMRGHRGHESEDLAQEFFLHLCEHSTLTRADRLRGRFRSFLLGSLVKFLANARDHERAQKRGGGIIHLGFEELLDSQAPAVPDESQSSFDRTWAATILANAMSRINAEFTAAGRAAVFGQLKRFLPSNHLPPSYESAAEQLTCTVACLKSEVHRLRLRFRALIREEVAATVSVPHEIEAELNHLQAVLTNRGNTLENP